ncbi:hypothetical protein N7540_004721 [Penicillium herquei]|nr:hypothetical protein N7540_004721 [Penicillium herquei]
MSREDVEFKALDGVTLRGHFYPASSAAKSPAVIMTPGFNTTRDVFLPNIAHSFQTSGISCLVYDPRTIGSSDGQPRNNINPFLQISDYHDALTFLKSDLRINPQKIIYWGFSFAGAIALCAAALDKRAKAVIAINPLTVWDLPANKRTKVLAKAMQDRESQAAGNEAFRLPMLTETGENPAGFGAGGIGEEELKLVREAKEKIVGFEDTTTLQTYYNIVSWSPFEVVQLMGKTAVLLISAAEDLISPAERQKEAYLDALQQEDNGKGGARDILVVEGRGHMDILDGESLAVAMEKQVEFVRKVLN